MTASLGDAPAEPRIVGISTAARAKKRHASPDRAEWLKAAIEDDRGRLIPNLANAALVLRSAPELREAFSFDELQRQIIVERELPLADGAEPRATAAPPREFSDADASQVQEWLQRAGLPKIGRETVHQAIGLRAQERAFHPVREYLDGLAWDGVARLDGWLARYMRADPTPYVSAIGRMFLIAAAARIFEPGCKADYVLVLEGVQGAGKSRACATLGGAWFSDSLPDVNHAKDAAQHLRGKWFVEIAELSALGRAEAEALKSFISRPVERYRAPYDREEVVEPRQCVFIGTTNRSTYLGDDTGGRRFWPVRVGQVDNAALAADRDQLFAEAVAAYRAGAQWWPDEDFERQHIRVEQEARFEVDAWEPDIELFLSSRNRVQVSEVARDALGIVTAKVGTAKQRRIARVLTRLGWTAGRDASARFYQRPACDA
jgi:predicted P-loop ATPase